jgi:ActR/RegA family two-component response regulator
MAAKPEIEQEMSTPTKPAKMALVVHADMGVLSAFQTSLVGCGYVVILARDLPTALLAITQHFFDLAIISSRLAEGGDGWPLAGVVHLVFPQAFIGVLTPETSVLTLQSAINNGVTQLFDTASQPSDVVSAVLRDQGEVKEKRSVH